MYILYYYLLFDSNLKIPAQIFELLILFIYIYILGLVNMEGSSSPGLRNTTIQSK